MIDIKSKSDVIIPFQTIGDENWQEQTEYILNEYARNWNLKCPKPISFQAITTLEQKLKTTIPEELKLFYTTFGLANIGEELLPINKIEYLSNHEAILQNYESFFTAEELATLHQLIVFSNSLGNGNKFCFHSETKGIYFFDHDSSPHLTKLFSTASDYIKACLINCQIDLFNQQLIIIASLAHDKVFTVFLSLCLLICRL